MQRRRKKLQRGWIMAAMQAKYCNADENGCNAGEAAIRKLNMLRCIIVAVADDGAIGAGGTLPWHISEDLKFFKRTTMGCPVIMGRRTFESLGRPLPGRLNIVLSRTEPRLPEGVLAAKSLQEAFEAAEQSMADQDTTSTADQKATADPNATSTAKQNTTAGQPAKKRAFVLGGAEIYRQAMDLCDELYITRVHLTVQEADAWFPAIDRGQWALTAEPTHIRDEKSGVELAFEHYRKR